MKSFTTLIYGNIFLIFRSSGFSNLLFWRLDIAYFREKKDLSFDELAGPVKKMAISQHGQQSKLTKLYNYGHKKSKRFTQRDYSNNKAHTLAIKLAINSDIC